MRPEPVATRRGIGFGKRARHLGEGTVVEQVGHSKTEAGPPGPADRLNGEQAVTAQAAEGVRRMDVGDAEDFCPDTGEQFRHRRAARSRRFHHVSLGSRRPMPRRRVAAPPIRSRTPAEHHVGAGFVPGWT
jgi:hypothetical protein